MSVTCVSRYVIPVVFYLVDCNVYDCVCVYVCIGACVSLSPSVMLETRVCVPRS